MPDHLETIINELRGMREDMHALGKSILPNDTLLQAALPIAELYEQEIMGSEPDSAVVLVPLGSIRRLISAIAEIRVP